ncbi:MAG: hypothetical protein AAGD13_00780 [Pseudomonadota bacterium]
MTTEAVEAIMGAVLGEAIADTVIRTGADQSAATLLVAMEAMQWARVPAPEAFDAYLATYIECRDCTSGGETADALERTLRARGDGYLDQARTFLEEQGDGRA